MPSIGNWSPHDVCKAFFGCNAQETPSRVSSCRDRLRDANPYQEELPCTTTLGFAGAPLVLYGKDQWYQNTLAERNAET